MESEGLLRGLIAPRLPDAARVQRQNRRARLLFFLSLLLFVPIFLFFALIFASAWSAASWGDFFNQNLLSTFAGLCTTIGIEDRIAGFLRKRAEQREQALLTLPMRQAARAGSDALAPEAAEQPERLTAGEQRLEMTTWGPLMQPLYDVYISFKVAGWVIFAVSLLFLALFVFVLVDPLFDPTQPLDSTGQFVALVGLGVSAVACIGSIAAVFLARRMPRGFAVQADDWHLEWRRLRWWGASRKTTQMPWHEARAFYAFIFEQKSGAAKLQKRYRVYVLDGEQTALAWAVPDGRDAVAEATATADAFLRLVASRTRLSLRDVSGEVEQLGVRLVREPILRRKKQYAPLYLQALQKPADEQPLPPFKWPYARYVFLLPVVLFGLFAGVGWGAQAYQSHQYEALLAQVQSHKPLYYDSLAAPTGDWLVRSPTSDDSRSYSYSNYGYQLTGGYFTVAFALHVYRDVAVQVATDIIGGSADLGDIWLGMALHMDGDGNGLLFQVNPGGDWGIGTFDNSDFHHSGALNVIKNRLTVIIRGDDYICFANGHFMGIYHSSQYAAGYVGVFLGTPDAVAAFTNFTVYPL